MGSLIQIDSISIDLGDANDKNSDEKCDHFSIRGYVSEIRKRDWKKCWPFPLRDSHDNAEEQAVILQPLDVPKLRCWECQKGQKETAAEGTDRDYGAKCRLDNTSTHASSRGNALLPQSGILEIPKIDILEGKQVLTNDAITLGNGHRDLASNSDHKGEKVDIVRSAKGRDIGLKDNMNPQIFGLSIIPQFSPKVTTSITEKGQVHDIGSRSLEVSDIDLSSRDLRLMAKYSARETSKSGKHYCDPGQQSAELGSLLSGVGTEVNETDKYVESHNSLRPSMELDDNGLLDNHLDASSGLLRRKARKVRLLVDLLDSKGHNKNDHMMTQESPSNGASNASAALHTPLVQPVEAGVQKNTNNLDLDKKGKLPLGELCRPAEILSQKVSNKEVKNLQRDAEKFQQIRSEDRLAGTGFHNTIKNQCSTPEIDRSLVMSKRSKKVQANDACLPSLPPREKRKRGNHDAMGRATADDASNTISFGLSTNVFTGKVMVPCPLHAFTTDNESSLSKRKGKMSHVDEVIPSLSGKNVKGIEDSFKRKDTKITPDGPIEVPFQSAQNELNKNSSERALHLSLNSYLDTQSRLSFSSLWHESASGVNPFMRRDAEMNKVRDPTFPSKYGKGECDISAKGGFHELSHKTTLFGAPFINEKHDSTTQAGENDHFHRQQMEFTGAGMNKKSVDTWKHSSISNQHGGQTAEQGTVDDIPMEIVELMAKNQYERGLHDAKNKSQFVETTHTGQNAAIMSNARNGMFCDRKLQLSTEGTSQKRKSQAKTGRNGTFGIAENVGSNKRKSNPYFSPLDENHFNVNYLGPSHTPFGISEISQCQKKPSNELYLSATGPSRLGAQNCNSNGAIVGHGPFPTRLQALGEYYSQRNGLQQCGEASNLWMSITSDQVQRGYNIPRKIASQSSNINALSHCSGSLQKQKMKGNSDLKSLNLNAPHVVNLNGNFGAETSDRMSREYPFPCKHSGIGLHQHERGTTDLYSNETIPAMHLLSLMDAGMKSGPPFNLGVDKELLKRSSCAHDCSTKSVNGVSRNIGFLKQPESDFYVKNHLSENSHGFSLATEKYGASTSSVQQNNSSFRANNFTGQNSSKKKEKLRNSNSPMQNIGRKSEKSIFEAGDLNKDYASIPLHSSHKGFPGVSDSKFFRSLYFGNESSPRCALEAHGTSGTLWPPKSSSQSDVCNVNRNPADFSMPEPGNVYMIKGEDLQFGHAIPSGKRPDLISLRGCKQQKNLKRTNVKERANH